MKVRMNIKNEGKNEPKKEGKNKLKKECENQLKNKKEGNKKNYDYKNIISDTNKNETFTNSEGLESKP